MHVQRLARDPQRFQWRPRHPAKDRRGAEQQDVTMNILMISDVYFPRVNGVSTSMQTFCRELVGRGHAVTIVAPDYGVADGETEFEMIRLPARGIFFDP